MKPDDLPRRLTVSLEGDWLQREYSRFEDAEGRTYWLLLQTGPRTNTAERRRRVSVLCDAMGLLFRVQGMIEADKSTDPVVIGLEAALEAECLRRLQVGDWEQGTTYDL